MKLLHAGRSESSCRRSTPGSTRNAWFTKRTMHQPARGASADPRDDGLRRDYVSKANDTVVTLAMVETADALENVEEVEAALG